MSTSKLSWRSEGSVLSVGPVLSIGSALSARSRWSLMWHRARLGIMSDPSDSNS